MLHDQQQEYEREFEDFENMANSKVADLEKFYETAMNNLEAQLHMCDIRTAQLTKELKDVRTLYETLQVEFDKLSKNLNVHNAESKKEAAKYDKLHKK